MKIQLIDSNINLKSLLEAEGKEEVDVEIEETEGEDDENNPDVFKLSYDISEFEPWSGAIPTYENIKDAEKLEEFFEWVKDNYKENLSENVLNDLLWYEPNRIYRALGMKDYIKI